MGACRARGNHGARKGLTLLWRGCAPRRARPGAATPEGVHAGLITRIGEHLARAAQPRARLDHAAGCAGGVPARVVGASCAGAQHHGVHGGDLGGDRVGEPQSAVRVGSVRAGSVRVGGVVSRGERLGGPATAAPADLLVVVPRPLAAALHDPAGAPRPLVVAQRGEHAGWTSATSAIEPLHCLELLLPSRVEPAEPGDVVGEHGEVRAGKRRRRQSFVSHTRDQLHRES